MTNVTAALDFFNVGRERCNAPERSWSARAFELSDSVCAAGNPGLPPPSAPMRHVSDPKYPRLRRCVWTWEMGNGACEDIGNTFELRS